MPTAARAAHHYTMRSIFVVIAILFAFALGAVPPNQENEIKVGTPFTLIKRDSLQVNLLCYVTHGYHASIIVDNLSDGKSYCYHATQRGNTRTYKMTRSVKPGGSYINTSIPKATSNVPVSSNIPFNHLDQAINTDSLLPDSDKDCWDYIKKALQVMVNNGWLALSDAKASYNSLNDQAVAHGMQGTCIRWN